MKKGRARPFWAPLPVILALCYPPPATAPGPLRARAEAVETGHSKLEGVSHSKRSAHQPDDPDPTGPGRRRRGSPAGPHAHAPGPRDGAGAGIRPRRGRPNGLPAGGQVSRLGQYKYELTKRDKEAKRRQRSVTFKEVRLTPKIGSGDFDTKVHRAIEFLEDGDRIKVTVRFRGRELTHPELGRNMLTRFTDRIKEHGTPERAPLLEGKSMHLTVASLHKPKEHDVPARPPRPEEAAANGATPAPKPAAA